MNVGTLEWLDIEPEIFCENYNTQYKVKLATKRVHEIFRGLTKRYNRNIRANSAYLFGMMAKFGYQKNQTKESCNRILRLLETGDNLLINSALIALLHFEVNERISIQVTKYALNIEQHSELGFQIIERQNSRYVARLLNIALRLDSINENWMREM